MRHYVPMRTGDEYKPFYRIVMPKNGPVMYNNNRPPRCVNSRGNGHSLIERCDMASVAQVAIRFWGKVDVLGESECWEWKGFKQKTGYGLFRYDGSMKLAHRIAYMLTHGDLSRDLCICHSCDNCSCVNPSHLWIGTRSDNMRDMWGKGRHPKGVTRGEITGTSKLTNSQVEEIRQLWRSGLYKQRDLAQMFDVSRANISLIVNRKSWA